MSDIVERLYDLLTAALPRHHREVIGLAKEEIELLRAENAQLSDWVWRYHIGTTYPLMNEKVAEYVAVLHAERKP